MTRNPKTPPAQTTEPPALQALRRAAKQAVAVARQTGTPAYVLEKGQVVDATKTRRSAAKNGSCRAEK